MLRAHHRPPPSAEAGSRLARLFRRPPKSVIALLGTLVVVLAIGALAFGPLVRARVAKEAERRRLDVEVGRVRPGFFSITLRDVRARPRGEGSARLEARLDEVRVDLSAGLSLEAVAARGGGILVEGEPDDVAVKVRELRAGGPSSEAKGGRGHIALSVEDLALSWKLPDGGELAGSGIRVTREESGARLVCARCSARRGAAKVEALGADIDVGTDGTPRRVKVETVAVTYEPPSRPAAVPTVSATEIVPPPLPPSTPPTKRDKAAKSMKVAPPAAPEEPVLPLPDLHGLRARIATAVAVFAPRVPDGGNVEIGGLTAKLDVGGEPITLGPGAFSLSRQGERIHLAFESVDEGTKDAKGTPLSVDAELPVGAGDITVRLAGGPVSLQVLGVKEGMKGLMDVAHGTVSGKGQLVLAAAADALTFDGNVALRGIALKQPRLAPEPLRGIEFSVSGRGVLDDRGKLRVDDAQLDMGALHVRTHGTIEETADHFAIGLALDVAPAACQALLESAPQGLLPLVRAARMTGTFAANVNLAFDTRTIDKLTLDYRIEDQCRMLEVPRELSIDRFAGSFTYRTYHPDGTIGETTTGPGTTAWTAIDDVSPFMIDALLTTEDGAFYKHKGFNHSAIRSSVQANLKARRFVRGASTITMQLSKNLFLARDKALSRKIEEVILTDYLEQVLRKDDLMELYLNVVEFGPDVYGITHAAQYYFGRKPEELHVAECFFLASLLPSPIRYGKLRDKGEISESWLRHVHALMEIAARNRKITRAELEDGLKEPISFVRPGDPRPEPRKPVTATRRDPFEDDAAWRPVD